MLSFIFSVALFITTNVFIGKLYFLALSVCSILTAFKLEQVANAIKRERLCNFPHKHIKFDTHRHKEGEK